MPSSLPSSLSPPAFALTLSSVPISPPTPARQKWPTSRLHPHVARRQRVRAGDPPQSTPPSEKPRDEDETDDLDRSESDLALPNLKELFEKGGKPGCPQCEGKGEILCPVCDAKGYVTLTMMDTTSSNPCRMCQGGRIIPCPSCRQIVYKSVVWWDKIPSSDEDPDEKWREGPDGEPRISWTEPPAS